MSDKTVARLDYHTPAATSYLHFLLECVQKGLIVPSLDRDLTDSGRTVVRNGFGDTLDISKIVRIVEKLRQGNPDLSEVDAFVYEASDVVQARSSDDRKSDIDIRECKMLLPRKGTYFLAGIYVLREATRTGMVEINPPGSPPDQCYIKYN